MAVLPPRVILVDDEPAVLELCRRGLTRYDLNVLPVDAGWDAVDLCGPFVLLIVGTHAVHWNEIVRQASASPASPKLLLLVHEGDQDAFLEGTGIPGDLKIYEGMVKADAFCSTLALLLEGTDCRSETKETGDSAELTVEGVQILSDEDEVEAPLSAPHAGDRAEVNRLTREVEKLKGQVTQLKSKLEEALKRQKEAFAKPRPEGGASEAALAGEKQRYEREVTRLQTDLRHLKELLEVKRKEVETLLDERKHFKVQTDELERRIAELAEQKASISQELEDANQREQGLASRLEHVQIQLGDARTSSTELGSVLAQKDATIGELGNDLAESQAESESLLKERQGLQADVALQRQQLREAEARFKEVDARIKEAESVREELLNDLKETRELLAIAGQENASLAEQVDQAAQDRAGSDKTIEEMAAKQEVTLAALSRALQTQERTLQEKQDVEAELAATVGKTRKQQDELELKYLELESEAQTKAREAAEALASLDAERARQLAQRDEELAEKAGLLAQRDEELAEKAGLLAQRDEVLAEKAGLLAQREEQLAEKAGLLAKKDGEIEELLTRTVQLEDEKKAESEGSASALAKLESELKKQLAQCDEELAEKAGLLARRDEELAEKAGLLARRDEELAEKAGLLSQRDEQLAEKAGALAKKDGEIEELLTRTVQLEDEKKADSEAAAKELSKLETKLKKQLAQRDEELAEKAGLLARRDEELAEKAGLLAKKDGEIEELLTRTVQLEDEKKADSEAAAKELSKLETKLKKQLAQRDEELAEKAGLLSQRDEELAEKAGLLAKKDGEIEELLTRTVQLEDEKKAESEESASALAKLESELREQGAQSEELVRKLAEQRAVLEERDAQVAELLDRTVSLEAERKKDAKASAALQARLEESDAQVEELLDHAAKLEAQAKSEAQAAAAVLARLEEELKERIALHEAVAADRDSTTAEWEVRLAQRDAVVSEKEGRITELTGQAATLAEEKEKAEKKAAALQVEVEDSLLARDSLTAEVERLSQAAATATEAAERSARELEEARSRASALDTELKESREWAGLAEKQMAEQAAALEAGRAAAVRCAELEARGEELRADTEMALERIRSQEQEVARLTLELKEKDRELLDGADREAALGRGLDEARNAAEAKQQALEKASRTLDAALLRHGELLELLAVRDARMAGMADLWAGEARQNRELEQEVRSHQEQFQRLQETLSALQTEKRRLTSTLKEMENRLAVAERSQGEKEALARVIDKLRRELDQKEKVAAELAAVQRRAKQLELESVGLKGRLSESERLAAELTRVADKVPGLELNIASLRQEVEEGKQVTRLLRDTSGRVEQLERQIAGLKRQLEQAAETEVRLAEKAERGRQLEQENVTLRRKASEGEVVAGQRDALRRQLDEANHQVIEQQERLASLQARAQELDDQLRRTRETATQREGFSTQLTALREQLRQKEELFRVFEEEMGVAEEVRAELDSVRSRQTELETELEKTRARTVHERKLFMELEENYKSTIMGLNNDKEEALIRLSELEERTRRLERALKLSRDVAIRAGRAAQSMLQVRRQLRETIVKWVDQANSHTHIGN
jgi:chromosome segregation ATPase